MPYETGDYRELKFFEQVIDSCILRDFTGYATRSLWLMIRHANFPSGWTWPGNKRKELTIGLNYNYQLKGVFFLLRKGLFAKWGYAKTKGQKSLAFKLQIRLPQSSLPTAKEIHKELYDLYGRKDEPLTLRPLLSNLTTTLGQPYDHFEIEKDITLKNPKEPRNEISQGNNEKGTDYEELMKECVSELGSIAKQEQIVKWLKRFPEGYYYRIEALLKRRYPGSPNCFHEALSALKGPKPKPCIQEDWGHIPEGIPDLNLTTVY